MLSEFGLIAANTSRTRAYLAALERQGMLPIWVLLLDSEIPDVMPGQAKADGEGTMVSDGDWPEADFNPLAPLQPWFERLGLHYTLSGSRDINDPKVVGLIASSKPELLVYSGYGGALLRGQALDTGKQFLHVHGGYLPDFKGSTTNYYSLLSEQSIGASSIFLTADIDCGPIILRKRFDPPADRSRLDHFYDSAARARILVETLRLLQRDGALEYDFPQNQGGDTYYIIHPVLKHLAILAGQEGAAYSKDTG